MSPRLTAGERRFLETMAAGRFVPPGARADAVRVRLLARGLVRHPPGQSFVVLTPEGEAAVSGFRSLVGRPDAEVGPTAAGRSSRPSV